MISEDKLKESALDDNASIYAPREEKSEKQKLKDMNLSEKLSYFKSYYLAKTIIGLVVIGLAVYLIYTIASPKPDTVLDTAIVNYPFSDETVDKITTDMNERLKLDANKENIMIDASYYLGSGSDNSEYSIGTQQKLSTYMYAGELDVIIAPESLFQSYVTAGFFAKLTDILPTELLTTLSDSIFESTTEDTTVAGAYGIYLDNTDLFKESSNAADRPVLGILVNSKNSDNGVEFLKYLFNYNK